MKTVEDLENAYNWDLAADRARFEAETDNKLAAAAANLSRAIKADAVQVKLRPFRENLQHLASQLNEIQEELRSCQHVPTHQLEDSIQV